MKNYRQLIKELPSKSVTVAFGNFNIPTAKHESYIKVSKKIAESKGSDHIVYISNDKNLLAERKEHYLNLLFPNTKFVHSESTIPYIIESLSKKYRSITITVSEDKRTFYSKYLKEFTNVNLVSVAEIDPDSDLNKIKSVITKGSYQLFKESLPSQVRDIDGKLLMNELRQGLGLDTIKEQIKFNVDELREQYFQGKIFQVGDIVESNDEVLKIIKRGSNHVLLEKNDGSKISKWIQDIKPTDKEFIKLEESIDSRVTVDKNSGYNAAKDVLRYSDFKKLLKMNKGEVKEDVYAAEYKVKKWIGQDGKEHSRKIRPHRIDFKNSKANAAPAQQSNEDTDKEQFKKKYPIKADALGGGARNKGFDAFFKENQKITKE